MLKILLESDYTYKYKRIGKIAYKIRSNQVIILDHFRLCPMINFVLGGDSKLIKDMFEHGSINLIYINENYRELALRPQKMKEAVIDLKKKKKKSKTKETFFVKFLSVCPEYYDNK